MQVRWTTLASEDLQRITRHIQRDDPSAAREVAQTLYDNSMSLETLPSRGRTGRIAGTLELVTFPLSSSCTGSSPMLWKSCASITAHRIGPNGISPNYYIY